MAPERAPIDGDYEVIGQDEWLDPRLINQPYQVSASSIVRNFLQSVSSSSGSQLNQETEKAFHLTKSEVGRVLSGREERYSPVLSSFLPLFSLSYRTSLSTLVHVDGCDWHSLRVPNEP